jgi:hypothetical protein
MFPDWILTRELSFAHGGAWIAGISANYYNQSPDG